MSNVVEQTAWSLRNSLGLERCEGLVAGLRVQSLGKPKVETLFTDVYDELPWTLRQQKADLEEHVTLYAQHYRDFEKQL